MSGTYFDFDPQKRTEHCPDSEDFSVQAREECEKTRAWDLNTSYARKSLTPTCLAARSAWECLKAEFVDMCTVQAD